jgi:hypothetical protein
MDLIRRRHDSLTTAASLTICECARRHPDVQPPFCPGLHLRLHGSTARGEASEQSDVDLIAEFDTSKRLSLIDMVGLENRLAELLGVRVDLSPAKMLKEAVREKADREALLAF